MTKQELIRRISQQTGLDVNPSRFILETFFESVKAALADGEPIHVRGFGSFILKARAPKLARNISQNTAVMVAGRVMPAFKPSPDFIDQLRTRTIHPGPKQPKPKR